MKQTERVTRDKPGNVGTGKVTKGIRDDAEDKIKFDFSNMFLSTQGES